MSFHVVVHDVGHGQAVHAFTPNGQAVVIDMGCSASLSPLEWLRSQTSTIDCLVVTHPHGDHIDEILGLDDHNFQVRQLWRPKWLTEAEVREANQSAYNVHVDHYLKMSKRYSRSVPLEEQIGNPAVSGGVSIRKYASKDCGRSNINNHSGVVVFEYLGIKVVVPGDNERSSWESLLKNSEFLEAASSPDIFVASHHGRESGYHDRLFDSNQGIGKPRLCVVTDGPVQNTDAVDRYSYHARGWGVYSRSDRRQSQRYCVTTRADGRIEVTIGKRTNDRTTFLLVTTA